MSAEEIYYICSEEGVLDGPYSETEANRLLDEITWEERLNFKYPDDGKHPYEKVMDEVQSRCDEIQVFRMAGTDLPCQMIGFLDGRNGLKVEYVVAYVDYYQPVQYCSPDEVLSISGIDAGKRSPITRTNFGSPQIVNFGEVFA